VCSPVQGVCNKALKRLLHPACAEMAPLLLTFTNSINLWVGYSRSGFSCISFSGIPAYCAMVAAWTAAATTCRRRCSEVIGSPDRNLGMIAREEAHVLNFTMDGRPRA
jgi:hypothetical protein